jgi:hypothetical protein
LVIILTPIFPAEEMDGIPMMSDTPLTYCLPLNAPQATLDLVGGKGRSLSVLTQAGFPVPSGFHITTAAYECFLETNKLF